MLIIHWLLVNAFDDWYDHTHSP